jgi:hypothetical protein
VRRDRAQGAACKGTIVSELRAHDAKSPPYWLYPKARRRRRIRSHLLLDSRVFRQLCAPGRESVLANFRASLADQGFAAGDGSLPPLELSPLGLLAVLGVDPPRFDPIPLSPDAVKSGEYLAAMTLVIKLVEPKFRDANELQTEALTDRVDDLRKVVSPEALDLFDLCVGRVAARDNFRDPIIRQLSFDYLFRYSFPDHLREEVFQFFCASLFAAGESVAGLSKMRAVKVLWDRAYPRLLKTNPASRAELQALDRDMKLRTRKDFLGREVIHHAILGYETEDGFNPVTAFAPESEEQLRARSIAYKSALRVFLDQITPSDLEKISYKIEDWKPGAIAPCLEDGGFLPPVTTGDLPVYTAEKKPFPLDRAAADAFLGAVGVEVEEEADVALELED